MTRKIQLGEILVHRGALTRLGVTDILNALSRHEQCDWGDASQEGKTANDSAALSFDRIQSVYHDSHGTEFWIITEADHALTIVVLPDDAVFFEDARIVLESTDENEFRR